MESNSIQTASPCTDAQCPLPTGPLVRIAHEGLVVDIAPTAGGRIAQITLDDVEWLISHRIGNEAMIAWGCYPMLPWAGRIRHGHFPFLGRDYQLPLNMGAHAIHGVAFGLPWQVEDQTSTGVELSLTLPENECWPFGGTARQHIEVGENRLRMTLTLKAMKQRMPVTLGWHPWFYKPDQLDFQPQRFYPRDADGIATLPLAAPPPSPWDDCFLNDQPVLLHRHRQRVRLTSDCNHWVIYDEPAHATCVEPQTGPPDAFNLGRAQHISPGGSLSAWFLLEWV